MMSEILWTVADIASLGMGILIAVGTLVAYWAGKFLLNVLGVFLIIWGLGHADRGRK